jgi:hypothetical protein
MNTVRKPAEVTPTEVVSKERLGEIIDRASQRMLGVSRSDAFEMMDRGELDGTMAGDNLSALRYLLEH